MHVGLKLVELKLYVPPFLPSNPEADFSFGSLVGERVREKRCRYVPKSPLDTRRDLFCSRR